MGNMCGSCTTCTEFVNEAFNPPILENYQKHNIKAKDLDRYDLFFRIVGMPMIELTVDEVFDELNILVKKYQEHLEK